MLRLEDFMEIQKLHHDGWSVTEIARHLDIDSQDSEEVSAGSSAGVRAQAEELEDRSLAFGKSPWATSAFYFGPP